MNIESIELFFPLFYSQTSFEEHLYKLCIVAVRDKLVFPVSQVKRLSPSALC